jgi:hypothetical protein
MVQISCTLLYPLSASASLGIFFIENVKITGGGSSEGQNVSKEADFLTC